jgi:hypothetical protein
MVVGFLLVPKESLQSQWVMLYEIDGQPAIQKIFRDRAVELPQGSLRYPLNVTPKGKKNRSSELF